MVACEDDVLARHERMRAGITICAASIASVKGDYRDDDDVPATHASRAAIFFGGRGTVTAILLERRHLPPSHNARMLVDMTAQSRGQRRRNRRARRILYKVRPLTHFTS